MTRTHLYVCRLAIALLTCVGSTGGVVVAQQQQQPITDQSISPAALAQIAALRQEKAARTPAERKIASRLLYAIKMERGETIAPGVHLRQLQMRRDTGGRFDVDVTAHAGTDLHTVLTNSGANVVGVDAAVTAGGGTTARAYVDANRILALAARSDVTSIRPHQGYLLSGVNAPPNPPTVSSEGDATHLAAIARLAFGVDGTGIKIGVLSDGVTNLANSQAAGEVGPVIVLPGQIGSGDHGTAMLEIIHDLAPGAQLYFASGTASITQFAQNIRALRTAGCDIIVDDVVYSAESPFQDGQTLASTPSNGGVVTQAVKDVTAAGALYFAAAGDGGNVNDGTSGVWEGDFVGTTTPAVLAGAGSVQDFGGGQPSNQMTSAAPGGVTLHWSDPLGSSANDYDIYVLDSGLTTIFDASTDVQDGTQDPYEEMGEVFINERLVIAQFSGSDRFLHLDAHRGTLTVQTAGQVAGHGAAADAFSVAATPAAASFSGPDPGPYPGVFTTANKVETFSSDGPRRIFFLADGTPITPGNFSSTGGLLRQKPDITAADGVTVSGAGGLGVPFYGTSAAAPHAAAIAALIKQARPAATPSEIRTWLVSTALDIEAAGVDRDSGAGIIMPAPALLAAGVTGSPLFTVSSQTVAENPGNGDGVLYGGEGGRLTLALTNTGFSTATGIQATLTTSTPGVTITQPASRTYPDLAASATASGAAPFTFTLPSNATCGLTVDFTLTVTFAGGASPQVLTVPVQTGVMDLTQVFDATAPSASPLYTAAAGQQSASLTRNATASSCVAAKTFPGSTVATPTIGYESYALTTCASSPASCAQISLKAPSGSGAQLFSTAFNGSFDPSDLSSGYAGDLGQTHTDGVFASYGVSLGAAARRWW